MDCVFSVQDALEMDRADLEVRPQVLLMIITYALRIDSNTRTLQVYIKQAVMEIVNDEGKAQDIADKYIDELEGLKQIEEAK